MIRHYYGVQGAAFAWLVAKLAHENKKLLVVCRDRKSVAECAADIEFFEKEAQVVTLPAWDNIPLENVSPPADISAERINALQTISSGEHFICLTSIDTVMQRVLPAKYLLSSAFDLHLGLEISLTELRAKFEDCGYAAVSIVEEIGDLAVRGSVIDFYPFASLTPIRVEIEDNKVVKLKYFDADSQLTSGDCQSFKVLPVREILNLSTPEKSLLLEEVLQKIKVRAKQQETPLRELNQVLEALRENMHLPGIELMQAIGLAPLQSVLDYLPADAVVLLDNELGLRHQLDAFLNNVKDRSERLTAEHMLVPSAADFYFSEEEFFSALEFRPTCYVNRLDLLADQDGKHEREYNLNSKSNIELVTRLKTLVGSGKALRPLKQLLDNWRANDWSVAFVVGTQARAERLQRALLAVGMDVKIRSHSGSQWMHAARRDPLVILLGSISAGFSLENEMLAFISENEVFHEKSQRKTKASKISMRRILNSLSQLQPEDYIVHTDFGIGIYKGLKHLEIEGSQGDFLHIEYADSRLYLPVHNIGKVQKFYAGEGQAPAIDKLSSNRWSQTKLKIKKAVIALAGDLIKLYAARSVAKGWRFEPYGAEDERFADEFQFNETPDQMRTIREVIADMSGERPMDRLVCGDVGFGKTEVALRAAFKCTQHARQVAVLVPTTILVEQHFNTFKQRFSGYPVKIAAISRFHGVKENKSTLKDLSDGTLDIIIGTHRLLGRDVVFKDLGLVIIDEEHRFGVQQKEKLKQMKKQVDVLSLTATPIPRTLHMSLLDIRDTSVIATPPVDRRVIRTYVASYSDSLVRDAILREVQRGGQCFFLHNRVQNIDLLTAKLAQLVPEARFDFAHGQMSESQLEGKMQKFIKHEVDVLVSTTIIESGLDIPNANTIIIEKADAFGLAQLYQLRGRVGRSNKQAYAYFLVSKTQKLSADAQKRLQVLQSLDDLGLGFNLAIRDLEIRGAGNLLGKEQSGNVLAVGFELYSKILKEAVLNIKGKELPAFESIDPEMKLSIPAYIPEYYIPDVSERLVLYQRLAALKNSAEADEMLKEIEDRFGTIPTEVLFFVEVMRLRSLLRYYAIAKCEVSGNKLALSFSPQSPLDSTKVATLVQKNPAIYKFSKNLVLTVNITPKQVEDPIQFYYFVDKILSALRDSQIEPTKPSQMALE